MSHMLGPTNGQFILAWIIDFIHVIKIKKN